MKDVMLAFMTKIIWLVFADYGIKPDTILELLRHCESFKKEALH